MQTSMRLLSILSLGIAVFLGGSCTKDDIPTTPPGPFLFSALDFTSKDLSPLPGTPLVAGRDTTVRFVVDYTFSPEDFQKKRSLQLLVNFYGYRSADSTVISIGAFPDKVYPIDHESAVITDSLRFTVPTNADFTFVQAFIDSLPVTTSPAFRLTTFSWPIR